MRETKKLIETIFPLREISLEAAREKSIRHGHISTLHLWWARKPLVACRAAILETFINTPSDPISQGLILKNIAKICTWEESNNPSSLKLSRQLIAENNNNVPPKILDCFAGGGSIPLEALRVGCEAYASDLNPVAVLLNLCTVVYPQKFGKKSQIRDKQKGLSTNQNVTIQNQLSYDLKNWGDWVFEQSFNELQDYFSLEDDSEKVVAFVWARTVKCQKSSCGAEIPLIQQPWLVNRPQKKVAIKLQPDKVNHLVNIELRTGPDLKATDFSVTMKHGTVECPCCKHASKGNYLRDEALAGRMKELLIAVITKSDNKAGKNYRLATKSDRTKYANAEAQLEKEPKNFMGMTAVPNEAIPRPPSKDNATQKPFFVHLQVVNYGLKNWGDLFNARQKLALTTLVRKVREANSKMIEEGYEPEYAKALTTYLALGVDRVADYCSNLCIWHTGREVMSATIPRPALPMMSWSYVELNPFSGSSGDWRGAIDWIIKVIDHCSLSSNKQAQVQQASATKLPFEPEFFDAVITDPPYCDNVPYSDLSDFFYVWLKRTVAFLYPELFSTPTTPKNSEILQNNTLLRRLDAVDTSDKYGSIIKNEAFFESRLADALNETRRVLKPDGTLALIFAHKTTVAWENLISALLRSGFYVSASWPVHTEMMARLQAKEHAALASSTWLICHKVSTLNSVGSWKAVQCALEVRIKERLDYFLSQGIKGADALLSAIGPALEVYGRFQKVEKVTGEVVGVSEFLDKVREVVAHYALTSVLSEHELGKLDPETAFYVLWKWTFEPKLTNQSNNGQNENKSDNAEDDGKQTNGNHALVPFDDGLKLARSVGANIDVLLNARGLLQKEQEYVILLGPDERKAMHGLGEISREGINPPVIDMIHKALNLWSGQEQAKLEDYLRKTGAITSEPFWTVTQALSNLLPLQSREKQLLDGLIARHSGQTSEPSNGKEKKTLDEYINKVKNK